MCPAVGASRPLGFSHRIILPLVSNFVNFKLGHCGNQIRPLRVKTGRYPGADRNKIGNPEPLVNLAANILHGMPKVYRFTLTAPACAGSRAAVT